MPSKPLLKRVDNLFPSIRFNCAHVLSSGRAPAQESEPPLVGLFAVRLNAQITVSDNDLRQQIGFVSHHRGEEAIKSLEKLRNNLAHAQNIVSLDWETIVAISDNFETVIQLGIDVDQPLP